MFLTPDRLMSAGQSPPRRRRAGTRPTSRNRGVREPDGTALDDVLHVEHPADHDGGVAAHAVIQYDHAFAKPVGLPNATRA